VSTALLKRPKDRKHDEGPKTAHIRDWDAYDATGEIKGLCGRKLNGVRAVRYRCCVVCLSLDSNRRLRFADAP
jgi:hypothetical protein